jgi:hypothetical protein
MTPLASARRRNAERYITSLWTRGRRKYAEAYWHFITGECSECPVPSVLGAARIRKQLERVKYWNAHCGLLPRRSVATIAPRPNEVAATAAHKH